MCKCRALTLSKPYHLYSGIDAAGSVLFYEPIHPSFVFLRLICAVYATAVIAWSMADLAEQNISYTMWFAFRVNWVTLLIWTYFMLSLLISTSVNCQKKRAHSLTIPQFALWQPEHDAMQEEDIADVHYNQLHTMRLYRLHQLSRLCLQCSLSAIVFLSAIYYVDYQHIFSADAIPEFVLNIQTHGVLAAALCVEFFASCVQLQYVTGTLLVLLFNVASIGWTFVFYHANFYNPFTGTNILYPNLADWNASHNNLMSMFGVWLFGTVMHWLVHMVMVYLKFCVICTWVDRRQFTMDIIDEKETQRIKSKKLRKLQRQHNNNDRVLKYSTY
eukprot:CAMPEP_0202688288 /NCGR_PEP_ID=MMETSP1385-20130828/3817_1 /ASSEMBLY_ACC=CAM_ASM_000861 /TAXON_ID=933848 /ORGANISM="Elphidium margaritaceum" /LENGTH=329 /DNA_ID=CAMNT_0049343223 /DNA_START=104 /DNA_END=1093 /DNA_ORIENTATION=+